MPQVTSFLHLWVSLSITNTVIVVDGGDQIAANLACLLIPLCVTDPRVNQWSAPKLPGRPGINVFCNVALFFIQVQAAIIYLNAGIGKLYTVEWKEGTALYYWISHTIIGAPDWLRNIYETATLSDWVTLLTWGVIIFEIGMFACIFANGKVKTIFLVLGFLFHFLIILTHGLLSFFFSMAALLVIYLDDANHSVRIINGLKNRIRLSCAVFVKPALPLKNQY
ncbi:hypothetical protein ECE50_012200 [Chitinophaga sp. Mgbs1]|uniref:HTTM-like domain-containing protein n=1 Tax=Chitinophaga solisilvae TaxID=1233460 RepID=A0A9Q5D4T9_9BACT|nr:hypothetical protein [Chitinophaga solisilvae]